VSYIVAYDYQATTYCWGCMREIAMRWPGAPTEAEAEHMSTEDILDVIANRRGIDRYDERSFDSGEFPKVIFENQACDELHEHCGDCTDDLCEVGRQ
jgi:hypothetical protein